MEKRSGTESTGRHLNILMVHPHDLYSPQEPWTVRIRFLAGELAKAGHAVTLAYHRLEGERALDFPPPEGVDQVELGRHFSVLPRNAKKLHRLARKVDIIHVQKCMPHAIIPVLWAAYMAGRRVHYDWDDWEFKIQEIETGGRAPGWLEWTEENLPRLVDTVSVASGELKNLALNAGVPEDRIFAAPVGADVDMFHDGITGERVRRMLDVSGPVVMYLGQLHATQYVGQFLEAGTLLLERQPNVVLVVVGSGWRLQELHEKARELGIEDKVIFTGSVPYQEVPEYLAAADIAVACFEDNEATRAKSPLKVVEYLAAGKAIVASSVGEVERMVSGCGVLVPPGDVEALSEAVNSLLLDPERRRELGEKAREKAVNNHSWRAVASNLEDAYRHALTF